jgi:hypothetical protein
MSSAAAAAAEMDAHKEEIRGTMTLTQHILLTQREHPVRPVVDKYLQILITFQQEATGQLTILLTAIVRSVCVWRRVESKCETCSKRRASSLRPSVDAPAC